MIRSIINMESTTLFQVFGVRSASHFRIDAEMSRVYETRLRPFEEVDTFSTSIYVKSGAEEILAPVKRD